MGASDKKQNREVSPMNEVVAFLKQNPVVYCATVGLDGKPKVRPFQYMLEQDGKFFFCTSNRKEVYREMKHQPYVEFCVTNTSFAWIRLKGKVVFSDDRAVKGRIMEENPLIKNIYQSPDNPVFEIFYLGDAQASIADFSGDPAKNYKL